MFLQSKKCKLNCRDNWVLFSQALSSLVKEYSENDKFLDEQNKYSQNLLISLIDYHKQASDKVRQLVL